MFTGIIEAQGKVQSVKQLANLLQLTVRCGAIFKGTKKGDSIAVNGICLTATQLVRPDRFIFEAMQETILKTTLKDLAKGSMVNFERALKANSRFGGHFVSGHVDGVGVIKNIFKRPNFVEFRINCDKQLKRFLVPKGSITLDGVSLTVGTVTASWFSVYLIPFTLKVTTLGLKKINDAVNIETDILAKYVLGRR